MSTSYNLDDLDVDFGDLRGLLDATYDILHEMDYERNGKRDRELDRVASLMRIAQQFAEQIERNLTDIGPRFGTTAYADWVKGQLSETPVRMTGGGRNG